MKNNFKKIYFFNATWSFLLIQPVVVPFFQSKGLSLSEVFTVVTVFSLTLSLLDIPTGYFSDRMGRRLTLLLASLFKGLGGTLLALSQGFYSILASYVLIGIGNSLYSGSDISLLHETNAAVPEELKIPRNRMFGSRFYYAQLGGVLASILGGLLGAWSLELTIWMNSAFAWVPLLVALTLKEAPRVRYQRNHLENFKKVFYELWGQSQAAKFFLVMAILYGAIPGLMTFALQGLFKLKEVPLIYFGYIFACLNIVGAFTSRHIAFFERVTSRSSLYFLITALTPVTLWGFCTPWILIILLSALLLEFTRGLSQALFLDEINGYLSSEVRATGNSVVSLGTRLTVAALGPLSGYISDSYGLSKAFALFAILYSFLFFIFVFFKKGIKNG